MLDVLGLVGVEEKSARQALARTAADGMLDLRAGRAPGPVGPLPLGPRAAHRGRGPHLRARTGPPGVGRALAGGRRQRPRAAARRRHRLRTRLAWAGLGSPRRGVWVSPDAGRLAEVREVLAEIDPADAHVIAGEYDGRPVRRRARGARLGPRRPRGPLRRLRRPLRRPGARHRRREPRRAAPPRRRLAPLPVPRPRAPRRSAARPLGGPPRRRGVPRQARRMGPGRDARSRGPRPGVPVRYWIQIVFALTNDWGPKLASSRP